MIRLKDWSIPAPLCPGVEVIGNIRTELRTETYYVEMLHRPT